MKSFIVLCVLALLSSTYGAPEVDDYALLVRSDGNLDLYGQTRNLIEELVANLRKSAQETLNAVGTFNAGIRDEVGKVRDKVFEDMNKFRNRVQEAVDDVIHRISNSSVAVRECVNSHRSAAAAVFNETLTNTMTCMDKHIVQVTENIQHMSSMGTNAMADATSALADMKKCTEDHTNLLATGTCLGAIVVQTQFKSVAFISQVGVTIARINIAIASLPAALNVCAGTSIVHTGIETSKIVVEIGTCSAKGVFDTLVGKPQV